MFAGESNLVGCSFGCKAGILFSFAIVGCCCTKPVGLD